MHRAEQMPVSQPLQLLLRHGAEPGLQLMPPVRGQHRRRIHVGAEPQLPVGIPQLPAEIVLIRPGKMHISSGFP